MTILWINLATVFMLAYFSRYFAVVTFSSNSIAIVKPNKLFICGSLLCLILVSGLRANIGDTGAYRHAYILNNFTWDYVKSQKDIGFGILQMILKNFTNDPQLMIFITAFITNVLIIGVFYKYSRMIELSIFVYITSGFFITSMNGIRQCLAAAIVFAATKFLFDGNWKRYFLVVLIATSIHETALILIPIYFIVRRKAWTRATFFLISIAIIVVLGFNQFSTVLFAAIQDTQYGGYKDFAEGGANVIRVAVEGAPLLIAFFGREKLKTIMPNSDYIVNMAVLSLVFMIISTQNWIFARFSIYFTLYQFILISWVVKLFKESNQRLIYFTILICYLIYHYYDSVITLNILYRSEFLDQIFR
ncbi:EpsG family protein [Neobacillus massiliamazoniensis]|uniref:Capsular polysaccharide biosynthesis protein n=1 Tax=Neobacillus massiliamazoniensis TaxID=1499688 RepID=A0A0U1NV87_9BACI|nr:EpsG family protein [Neobacillus massiliamazoniensis]CRK81672.1 capsular polysaccharide biosynthesis protein [Neobacillus massiliamazoniensis]